MPGHAGGGRGAMFGLGSKGEKPESAGRAIRRLLRELTFARGRIVLMTIVAMLVTLMSVATPFIMGMMTDELFFSATERTPVDFDFIGILLALLAGAYLLSSLFSYAQQFVMSEVTQEMVLRLREEGREKLDRLPVSFYDEHAHGDILSRFTNDLDLIGTTLKDSVIQTFTAFVTIIGVSIVMIRLSPILTLVTMITVPLTIFVTAGIASRSRALFKARQEALGTMNARIEEAFSGFDVMKSFGQRDAEVEAFRTENEAYFTYAYRASFISGVIRPLVQFVGNLGFVGIVTVGSVLVVNGSIGVGTIQAFIQYQRSFNMPIQRVAGIVNTIQSTLAAAERVFSLLDEDEQEPDAESGTIGCEGDADDGCGLVAFDDVTFSYRPGTPVISDVSFTAEPGETIAIVGPTGAGKSTIVNLLMRFYEVDSGTITIDGVDIRDIPREDLRDMTGMVLQDVWLRTATVAENIGFGAGDDVTRERIEQAATAALADDFIRSLPHGYDTVIGDGGTSLSAGQRQLITIARAFICDPKILIMDEATSSIDTRTELAIQRASEKVLRGRTSFVIAHRLSTIREADRILVLKDGRIEEQGDHEELLRSGGFYASLYEAGFSECRDEVDPV